MRPEDLACDSDRYALSLVGECAEKCLAAYEEYGFGVVSSTIYNHSIAFSSLYLTPVRDRLYCSGADSPGRRSAQAVLAAFADSLVVLLAPILPHLELEYRRHRTPSFRLSQLHSLAQSWRLPLSRAELWERGVMGVRAEFLRQHGGEPYRMRADVGVREEELLWYLSELHGGERESGESELVELLGASTVALRRRPEQTEEFEVKGLPTQRGACERCRRYAVTEKADDDLCVRCRDLLSSS